MILVAHERECRYDVFDFNDVIRSQADFPPAQPLANVCPPCRGTRSGCGRHRVYVTDIENHQWPVRNVRAEFIDVENPPVSTMVEVSRLAKPGNMIEIDMIAVTP